MMKIFSAAFFALCLIGTWYVVNSRPSIAYETHIDMEATLVQTITQFLAQEKPNAREFAILSLKSEVESPANVRVYFQYQFQEPDANGNWVRIQRYGRADLMKDAVQTPGQPEKWTLREGRLITKEAMVYEQEEKVQEGVDYDKIFADEEHKEKPAAEAIPTPTPSK